MAVACFGMGAREYPKSLLARGSHKHLLINHMTIDLRA